jgi:molybdate transport system substrate-binding protein
LAVGVRPSMPRHVLFQILCFAVGILAGCAKPPTQAIAPPTTGVTIFAAASTKDAVEELANGFQRKRQIVVTVIPGPSSGLARQIDLGADADLFLSADQASADFLATRGLVARRRNLLTNRLVVIVPADSELKISGLADLVVPAVKRLAVAEAKVPAGEYARDALRKAGVLERVASRFIGGVDVRQTLLFVARGAAEAGFVYLTDTIGNSRVRVAYEVPADLHRPIEYPLVVLQQGANKSAAVEFGEYLASPSAAEVFRAAKFGLAK